MIIIKLWLGPFCIMTISILHFFSYLCALNQVICRGISHCGTFTKCSTQYFLHRCSRHRTVYVTVYRDAVLVVSLWKQRQRAIKHPESARSSCSDGSPTERRGWWWWWWWLWGAREESQRPLDLLTGWSSWWTILLHHPESDADMEDNQRRTRGLGGLTAKSRVSRETKLRLRVIFLDDSERTFEVEVSLSACWNNSSLHFCIPLLCGLSSIFFCIQKYLHISHYSLQQQFCIYKHICMFVWLLFLFSSF